MRVTGHFVNDTKTEDKEIFWINQSFETSTIWELIQQFYLYDEIKEIRVCKE